MRAIVITAHGDVEPKMIDLPVPRPQAGEVQVRMQAASLNYRDLMLLSGRFPAAVKLPYVPLSCGSGVVTETGSGVTRVKVGDRVAPTYFQNWISGAMPFQDGGLALGGNVDGVAREYACFHEDGVVRIPDTISDLEAATLPCAALTAWSSLFAFRSTKPGDVVLLQGTGGVSIAGLQLAKAAGATTIVTSSSDAKLARAKALGADHLINYRRTPAWGRAARELTGGRGVDLVIEVGGEGTLAQSLVAVADNGDIAGVGLLGGRPDWSAVRTPARVYRVHIGNRDQFEDMLRALTANAIRPVIDRVFPLEHLGAAIKALGEGQIFGKACIQMTD